MHLTPPGRVGAEQCRRVIGKVPAESALLYSVTATPEFIMELLFIYPFNPFYHFHHFHPSSYYSTCATKELLPLSNFSDTGFVAAHKEEP